MKARSYITFIILFIFVYSVTIIANSYRVYLEEKERIYADVDQELKTAAYSAAELLGKNFHDRAVDAGSISPEEDRSNSLLLSNLTDHSDIEYVYTMIERNATLYFTSSSSTLEEQQNNDLYHYFDAYDEATDEDKAVFLTKKMFYEESADRWGTFRSVIIPMYTDGGNLYVAGADMKISFIDALLEEKVTDTLLSGLLFLFLLTPLMMLFFKSMNYKMKELKAIVAHHTEALDKSYAQEHEQRMVLELVADIHEMIISAKDVDLLLEKMCRRLGEFDHYKLAWAGLAEDKNIRVAAHSDDPTGYLGEGFSVSTDPEREDSSGPEGRVIRDNQTVVIEDTLTDRTFAPWRERAKASGFGSVVGLPLKANVEAEPFGALLIYTNKKNGFTTQEVLLLQELSMTVGFAINSLYAMRDAEALNRQQIVNYKQTIFSLVNMIEQRDTYTAGHSERVSRYCVLIAQEMGIAEEEVEQLQLAAILHDVGKLATPDAILLKPAHLTDLEYQLIQEHVSVGYELFNAIDMYKDLAQIIHAHHERHDGSGYPLALKGDEIPLLSAIMAVADSFDAMTTNRIYKPRMAKEEALEELAGLGGTAYHPDVVDAAVRALKEIEPDKMATQMPTTKLEDERFAYFFKDNLTSAFNKWYLDIVLKQNSASCEYASAYIIKLRRFGTYNQAHSWEAGDELLKKIADYIQQQCQGGKVFRIYGDHFIVLAPGSVEIFENVMSMGDLLKDTGVLIEVTHSDLSDAQTDSVRKLLS